MRKALGRRPSKADEDELRPEYHFDYSKSRPNRFARAGLQVTTIVLDEDVASVFHSSRAVNTALRALLVTRNETASKAVPAARWIHLR